MKKILRSSPDMVMVGFEVLDAPEDEADGGALEVLVMETGNY